MNYTVFINFSRILVRSLKVLKLQQNLATSVQQGDKLRLPATALLNCNRNRNDDSYKSDSGDQRKKQRTRWNRKLAPGSSGSILSAAFAFNLFSKPNEEEETPEDKLIETIKRSVLCMQREQYETAERMLHLALRMAQEMQSAEGITYVYDVMANLAMEREQFKKAEKLFVDVMQRLMAQGHTEDSPQILHISSKMAHIAQLQGELDKSKQGFMWTLKKIEENIRRMPDDKDMQELLGLTKNWYGQLQMKLGKYAEAKKLFLEAYESIINAYGVVNEEAVTILNNLSVACVNLDDFVEAKKYLLEALESIRELKDKTQEGILQANLGIILLREGLISEAKEMCGLAWRIGKQSKNAEAIEQAEYCLEEIKSFAQ